MTGSIIKRGERVYLLRISLGRDSVTGKRLYYTETVHGIRKDADARLRQKIAELEGGGIVKKSARTVNEFLQDWLKTKEVQVKRATLSQYHDTWKRNIEKDLGRLPLSKLSTPMVQEFYNRLRERLGPASMRQVHVLLHSAFKLAAKWRLIPYNPATDTVRPSPQKQKIMRAMTLEQALAFIRETYAHRYGYVLRFLLVTGVRPEEAFALQWADIDFEKCEVSITKALIRPRKGGGWYFDSPKTSSSIRRITIDPRDIDDLIEWRKIQLVERQFAGKKWLDGYDFVFTSNRGTPLKNANIKSYFLDQCYADAGAAGKRLYDLRHTNATLLLLAKEQAKIVSERLGHANIGITLDTYSHVLPAMDKQASKTITDMLRKTDTLITE